LMTNVTTLQPGDSEAAEVRDEEPQEDASVKDMPNKEVLDEIDSSEDEQDCFTDTQPRIGKPRIDLVKRELIDEVMADDGGTQLASPDEEMPTDDEETENYSSESEEEPPEKRVTVNPIRKRQGSRGKQRRFTRMGSSPGSLIVRPKKVKLTFVDDAEVLKMESFHYKTLTEKLSTEIAIVKYVSPRPESKRLIQEKAKSFKRELVFPDEHCSANEDICSASEDISDTNEDISRNHNNSNCVTEIVEGPAWVLPIDPACPVVSQLRLLVSQHFSSDDINASELCFEFPSLLSNPEFEPLVQTYLRVLKIPIEDMTSAQRQFADTMITELVTAGVADLPSLTSIFNALVLEMPGAAMDVWVDGVEKRLPGLTMATVCDPTFTTAGFVVVVLSHCLLNV